MPQLPNTRLLQAFEATVRYGNLSLAAKELFATPSSLSRQIQALENSLNLELFVRQKNRLVLTDVGRSFYTVLEKSLRDIATCTANMQRGLRRLVVKAPPSFAACWLAPRLTHFHAQHPCMISLYTEAVSNHRTQNYDCEIIFSHGNSTLGNATILFEEHIQPACSSLILKKIEDEGIDSVPVLHTLSGTAPLPYWDYWTASNRDNCHVPSNISVMSGMEFSTQQQAINAAIEGLGVLMVDIHIASQALKRKQLIALGEPVTTPFRYWLLDNNAGGEKADLVKNFCQWIEKEALVCQV